MAASISYQASATQAGGSTSRTLAFSVASAAGQERLVALLAICSGNPASVSFSSVSVDGQSATQVGSYIRIQEAGGNGPIVSFWRATGTSGTSINVTFNIAAGAVFDVRGSLWNLSGAGTLLDTGSDTISIASSNMGNAHLDLDTVTDGACAAIVLAYNSTLRAVTWSGLTERFDGGTLYTDDWFTAADLTVTSGSTPLTVTVTLPTDFKTNSAVAGLAVSFNPAATGTTLTAAAGSYALTGSAAGLNATANLTFPVAASAYALTGSNATFQVGGNFTLFCDSGSYALSGADASFPGYEPITPPVQPSTGGGYTGGAVYDTYRLRKKRKRDEIEELIDAIQGQAPATPAVPHPPAPPPPALVDLVPKMQAVGLTPPQRKIVKRAIVSDDPDDDNEAIELLLNLLS